MKTGFICASGFNVVATASRSGRKLITVVMGAPSARERTDIATGLFEANFNRSGGGFFSSTSSLTSLADSPYPSPTGHSRHRLQPQEGRFAPGGSRGHRGGDAAAGPRQ